MQMTAWMAFAALDGDDAIIEAGRNGRQISRPPAMQQLPPTMDRRLRRHHYDPTLHGSNDEPRRHV